MENVPVFVVVGAAFTDIAAAAVLPVEAASDLRVLAKLPLETACEMRLAA